MYQCASLNLGILVLRTAEEENWYSKEEDHHQTEIESVCVGCVCVCTEAYCKFTDSLPIVINTTQNEKPVSVPREYIKLMQRDLCHT